MEIEGLGQGSGGNFSSFVTDHVALIGGNSYPLILIANAQALAGGDGTLSNLVVQTARPHQTGIFFDQDNLGNNATQWLFRNVYARGAVPSQPFKTGGRNRRRRLHPPSLPTPTSSCNTVCNRLAIRRWVKATTARSGYPQPAGTPQESPSQCV
jgi:hypothetical protein